MRTKTTILATSAFLLALSLVSLQAAAPPTAAQGAITAKGYLNIGGTAVTDLTGNAKFPASPDVIYYYPYFEWNADATGDISVPANNAYGENYGAIMQGYFYPPATGDYIFWLSADDGANLNLSTDADPANKKLIAQEAGWSNARQWDVIGGGSTVEAKNSSTFAGTQWPTKDAAAGGAKITLTKGTIYYIEAIFKEGGGGDNLAVAVQAPDGSIDQTQPIPGKFLSTIDKTTGPLKILTQPLSQSLREGDPVTLSIELDGTPPYTYQWKKNGVDIADAINYKYSIDRVAATDNGAKFTVAVTGAQGSLTSAEATLTVSSDTAAPTIASIAGAASFTYLTVTFSEPVDPTTAATAANYKLSGGVTVSAASLAAAPNDNTLTLTTSKQAEGAALTLTVSGVKDLAGNTIVANSTKDFSTAVFSTGWATYERWHNEVEDPGAIGAFADAIAAGTMRAPDFSSAVKQFGGPWGARDNYSSRVSGFFIPATTGNYVFFVASDDQGNLYLSTDDSPANKKLIAQESGWSNQYQWQTVGGGSILEDKRSDTFSASEWPTPNTITLTAGKRYYIELLEDEGGGGDGSDATFIVAGAADPAQDASGASLKGGVIATFLDPNGATINISQQPVNTQGVDGKTATFNIAATGSSAYGSDVSYQWQKNGVNIAGATGTSYTTPVLASADSGSKFKVLVSVPTKETASDEVTLTVVPDTFPPKLAGAGSLWKGTAVELGIGFDEDVDATTASAAANYTLSKGTITAVRYQKYAHEGGASKFVLGKDGPFSGYAVVLATTGLVAGDNVTVTVKNVKDLKGNTMAAAGESKALTVTSKMHWAAMGGTDYTEGASTNLPEVPTDPALWPDDAIAYSESDFDLISGGTANWNNYDEATFVYEEVTGDFDKVVRVEYHDPTSQWARAGMCATPAADEGITRAQVEGGFTMAQRYMLRANPAIQWNGSAGNNQNEADWRDIAGGNYGGTGAGNPAYPNAWLRMQRKGQDFTGFYSADGKTWTTYGAHTFTASDTTAVMPDKLLVGIYYTPETGNNGTAAGVAHSSVGKFRQYGNFSTGGGGGSGTISIARTAGGLTLTFTGTLQSADAITGPWADVPGTSPQNVTATGTAKYYRSKQ